MIPSQLLFYQLRSTGWNQKELSGFTMKDQSVYALHHEQTSHADSVLRIDLTSNAHHADTCNTELLKNPL